MFLVYKYTFPLNLKITELTSDRKYDNQQIKVIIKLTNQILRNSPECLRLFNLVLKGLNFFFKFKIIKQFTQNTLFEL